MSAPQPVLPERRTLERFADLVVEFGANVQPGQMVEIFSAPGKEEVTRAIAERAFRAGAVWVGVDYADPLVQRARIEHGPDESLGFEPRWTVERARELGERRAATIGLTGATAPGALAGLDPQRIGRDRPPAAAERIRLLNEAALNWTAAPCATPAWASLAHPELEPDEALERLWQEIVRVMRLDEDDPVAAWQERIDQLEDAKRRLDALDLDAVHLEGEGTDLRIGLLPTSRWCGGSLQTAGGITHLPNLPTEEVFTSPDPRRAEGVVTATKPLYLADTMIEGLRVTFSQGRAVAIEADEGAGVLQAFAGRDDGASRLGELALVDGRGRVGPLGTVFCNTLLDENAASHIALGTGFRWAVGEEDLERVNTSEVHVDFMVGGDAVTVTGVRPDGSRVTLLAGGDWQI